MSRILSLLILFFGFFAFHTTGHSDQLIERYGQLPQVRTLAISPDGKYFSYIQRSEDNDIFVVKSVKTQALIFTGNVTMFLFGNTQGLHKTQTGLGKIVGLNVKDEVVYMPAFTSGSDPNYTHGTVLVFL